MNVTPSQLRPADIPPVVILGVPFDTLSPAGVCDIVGRMVAARRAGYVLSINAGSLMRAQEDLELRRILFDANVILCDGKPLLWASRRLGHPPTEQMAGSNLMQRLAEMAAEKGFRIFLLGATPEIITNAVANLKHKHPALIVAGQYSPQAGELRQMDQKEIARRIQEAKPDLLFVSFECPVQEKWIAMNYRSLGVPVTVGVGEAIRTVAGKARAGSGQSLRDLWLFGRKITSQWWQLRSRSRRDKRQPPAMTHLEADWQHVTLPERLDYTAVNNTSLVNDVLIGERNCLVELGNVKFIDSTGIGLLIRMQKRVRAMGRQLVLVAPSPEAQRAFELMHLRDFFNWAASAKEARKVIELRAVERDFIVAPQISGDALAWRGEVTAANGEQVWEETRAYLTALRDERLQLEIDLREVRFIDSTGVGVMIRAKKLALRQGVRMRFTNPSPAARNVLRLAHLEEFLIGS